MENNLKIEEKKENLVGTTENTYCKCGCGSFVSNGRRYLSGHNKNAIHPRKEVWAQSDEIIRLYTQENKNRNDIGKIFKCHPYTIYNILKKNNKIKPPSESRRGKSPSNKRVDVRANSTEIIRLFNEELISTRKIAEKFNCGETLIETILKENKVPRNYSERRSNLVKTGTIKSYNKRYDVWEKAEEIIKMYKEDIMSTKEISKKFNCTHSLIQNILKENNVLMNDSERRLILFKASKLKIWCDGLTSEMDERVKENVLRLHKNRKNQIFPMNDTKIEIKIQNFLSALHLEYATHKYMSEISHAYQCDIFIPKQETEGVIISKSTIIECDGDAFHFNPKFYKKGDKIFKDGMTAEERWKLDETRTKELEEAGYKVIRLWEHDIKKMEISDLKNELNLQEEKNG